MGRNILIIIRLIIVPVSALLFLTVSSQASPYHQVPGLIDIRSTFSDGAHDIESLVGIAKDRGFEVLILNDHDRMAMEYGLPPFRNLIKRRVERSSINKNGAKIYLDSIKKVQKMFPDMIIIPGSETAAFYYWTGSPFTKNLTAHDHERRILTIGMEHPKDYNNLPILHNGFSTQYVGMAIPEILLFLVVMGLTVFLIKWRGYYRIAGIIIFIGCIAFIANTNMFRSSPFDQYHGAQGIAPYQHLIDYVDSRGGMTFWNYPETKSGIRQMGPIYVDTPPYPEVLEEARSYTGFAAIYGDSITITEPGNIWDRVLEAYCDGRRNRPVWGISTADFHKEGDAGEKLGNFATVFLVRKKGKNAVLEALRNGKMYASRASYPQAVRLDEFSVSSSEDEIKGVSGDEIVLKSSSRIKIAISSIGIPKNTVNVRLIRSGTVIQSFKGNLPMQIYYEDNYYKPGKKIYYRMDMRGQGQIVSNPIFVAFNK